MSNPYEPPKTESLPLAGNVPTGSVHFKGGWAAVLAIGFVAGASAMSVYYAFDIPAEYQPNPFYVIAVLWALSLIACTFLLRGIVISPMGRLLTALIAFPVAYALYVPVCSFGTILVNGGSYDAAAYHAIPVSIVSFTLILFLICRMIRSRMIRRNAMQQLKSSRLNDAE
ncbi:hypothetical protein [Planctomycetes bacterium K23_9]|uniref:Uncharacterized protein n=1 Tax=Stieleria marina TaxID=1930275 RepID=A0A517NU51_9BACT|nr:hypothetical protein K239x_26000 [Planctomycetes bacterium K23_9]